MSKIVARIEPFCGDCQKNSAYGQQGSAELLRMSKRSLFKYFNTSPEIIRLAVMPYIVSHSRSAK